MTQETQFNRHQLGPLVGANKRDHYFELHYQSGEVARLYILADGIFRYFLDPTKEFNENHTSLVNLAKFSNHVFKKAQAKATSDSLIIKSGNYQLIFGQKPAVLSIFDESLHRMRLTQAAPLEVDNAQTTEILRQHQNEFYFGGGLQNGHFSHKGKEIAIQRDGITGTDGVLSQVPFFWSNAGFGEFRNTSAPGHYDFGRRQEKAAIISHEDRIFDNFYLLGNTPSDIIAKYYLLTGKPLMPPKYALKLGYIGNFLKTLWRPSKAKDRAADMFEDGSYYVRTDEAKQASGKASLNGEEEYQFSARAMIDRFQKRHFELGWFVPNYGQDEVNQEALATFNDYANTHGIESGLWSRDAASALAKGTAFILTQGSNDKLLEADTSLLRQQLNRRRSLILTSSGLTGSQNKTALIFGANGGNWESIRAQIATFIGANLSGEPLVGAAIDGSVGGGNAQIFIRDFEWKIFTPLLFSINDQSPFSKTPFAYNSKMTRITHAYLALRKQLAPYLYTLIYRAQKGQPIIEPLFAEFPHEQINYTSQVRHEMMLGPNLLIAPITNGKEDGEGHSRKDNLYLPSHRTMWLDLFTGKKYLGGRVYNGLSYSTWHLPVFVRSGAIFDLGQRNFVLYPHGKSSLTFYDDNDFTDFAHNHTETEISSNLSGSKLTVVLQPVKGSYSGMTTKMGTKLNIMCDDYPDTVTVKVNEQDIQLQEYGSVDSFAHAKEGFFYNTKYSFMPEFDAYHLPTQKALQIKLQPRDLTDSKIEIKIQNFAYGSHALVHAITDSVLRSPKQPAVDPKKITAHSLTVNWPQVTPQVQIEVNGIINDGITGSSFTFHELAPHTRYLMRLRYVAGNKVSEWSDPFGGITKRAASDYAVRGITTTCNYAAAPDHPLTYLTDLKAASEWQTEQSFDPQHPLVLTFNFAELADLSRMAFIPRAVDHRGTPTEVGLAISQDGQTFKPYGEHFTWKADHKNKVIGLRNVSAKAVRLTVYQSAGPIVAAQEVIFYRTKH